MPNLTGIWNQQEADQNHIFSYRVAQWIAQFLKNDDKNHLKNNLYDLGCGKGTYSRYFEDVGFKNVTGIDGENYEGIECSNYKKMDLSTPIDFENKGNVICLEVGEHIPEEYLQIFINNLTENCSKWLFLSWAVPGQEGIGHVSCRSNDWVKDELWKRGFQFMNQETQSFRSSPEGFVNYFKNTLMIFKKID